MWKCAYCGYRFEDWESLSRHQNEGQGCPENEPPSLDEKAKRQDMLTRKAGYEKGWQASSRTTTYDLDAAEDRYTAKYGLAGHDGFIAGWTDYAAGNEKWSSL